MQTKVTVRKRSIRFKIGDLLSLVTLKFDGWPCKTIGHLFYVARSFMRHFIAIGEFKLILQSGNAQIGSKSAIFCPVWPWNLTDDLEKKNNRAPLLCYFKPCASFCNHWWSQTGVTVQKRRIWVKIDDFFSRVTLKFDGWFRKIVGHLSSATSSFMHHFIIIVNSNWSYSPETDKLGYDLCDLNLWPMTLTFCTDITSVIGNNPWKFRDDTVTET